LDVDGCPMTPCRFAIGVFHGGSPAVVDGEIAELVELHLRQNARSLRGQNVAVLAVNDAALTDENLGVLSNRGGTSLAQEADNIARHPLGMTTNHLPLVREAQASRHAISRTRHASFSTMADAPRRRT